MKATTTTTTRKQRKQAQAGNEWSNILPKSSHARKKPPPPPPPSPQNSRLGQDRVKLSTARQPRTNSAMSAEEIPINQNEERFSTPALWKSSSSPLRPFALFLSLRHYADALTLTYANEFLWGFFFFLVIICCNTRH